VRILLSSLPIRSMTADVTAATTQTSHPPPSSIAIPSAKPAHPAVATQRGYGWWRWVISSIASCASSTVTPPAVIRWISRSSSPSRV